MSEASKPATGHYHPMRDHDRGPGEWCIVGHPDGHNPEFYMPTHKLMAYIMALFLNGQDEEAKKARDEYLLSCDMGYGRWSRPSYRMVTTEQIDG